MRIAIDLTAVHDHLTGIERYALNISRSLIMAHPEDQYVLFFKQEIHPLFMDLCRRSGVEARLLPCRNPLLFNQVLLPLYLYREKADVFFFPAFCAPWLFYHRCIVDTVHDVSDFECFEGKPFLKVLYARLGIDHAKHTAKRIVTVSRFSKERIASLLSVPENKIDVTYNGISDAFRYVSSRKDFADVAKRYQLPEKYLLSVSTLEPRKNLQLLIRAFSQFKEQDDLHLVLCGRAGWNLKQALGTVPWDESRIHITGFVEDEDLPLLYEHAKAFVFPSKYEGFGLPPLEAMQMSCVVLSSDAASMPEVLGDAALYFRSQSVEDLLRGIRDLLALSPEALELLKEKGRLQAQKYRWDCEAEKLHNALLSGRNS